MRCFNFRPHMLVSSSVALSMVLLAATLPAQQSQPDWPQWRGPDRDGVSKESGWSVTAKQRSLWEINVGLGYSTASMQGGRLYTVGHDKEAQKDVVFCLEGGTGKEIWKHSFPAKIWNHLHSGGTLSTPSVDGERVFVANREGQFLCLDAATGKVRWSRDLKKKYKLKYPKWGFAASPMVLDDMVIVNVGQVLAFKKSGKLIWQTSKNYGDAYSTPVEFKHEGRSTLAVFNGKGLVILKRKSGREVAFHEWKTRYDMNGPTPVVTDKGIFISSGYNRGCAMLELGKKKLKVLWESRVMRTQLSGCVLWKGHLYGFDESTLKCIDLSGKEKWAQKGLGKGALVVADGRIVALSSRGHLVIAEASPEGYKELSRKKVLRGGVYWTTPMLCGGLIYCRNSMGDLVCIDHKGTGD